MTKDDGYIKFRCHWGKTDPVLPEVLFNKINKWRNRLYKMNLIRAYKNGIGYGNLSIRISGTNNFYISGSATGNFKFTGPEHYTVVTNYNYEKNSLICSGPIKASSESLSHAAIYESNKNINAVIHVHHLRMWEKYINDLPTTNKEFSFGTPEIANDIASLLQNEKNSNTGIIIMGGHCEGILFFGIDIDEAGKLTTDYYNLVKNE